MDVSSSDDIRSVQTLPVLGICCECTISRHSSRSMSSHTPALPSVAVKAPSSSSAMSRSAHTLIIIPFQFPLPSDLITDTEKGTAAPHTTSTVIRCTLMYSCACSQVSKATVQVTEQEQVLCCSSVCGCLIATCLFSIKGLLEEGVHVLLTLTAIMATITLTATQDEGATILHCDILVSTLVTKAVQRTIIDAPCAPGHARRHVDSDATLLGLTATHSLIVKRGTHLL